MACIGYKFYLDVSIYVLVAYMLCTIGMFLNSERTTSSIVFAHAFSSEAE